MSVRNNEKPNIHTHLENTNEKMFNFTHNKSNTSQCYTKCILRYFLTYQTGTHLNLDNTFSHILPVGMQNGAKPMEKTLAISN